MSRQEQLNSLVEMRRAAQAVYWFLGLEIRAQVKVAMADLHGDDIGDIDLVRDWIANYPAISAVLEGLGYNVGALEASAIESERSRDARAWESMAKRAGGDLSAP